MTEYRPFFALLYTDWVAGSRSTAKTVSGLLNENRSCETPPFEVVRTDLSAVVGRTTLFGLAANHAPFAHSTFDALARTWRKAGLTEIPPQRPVVLAAFDGPAAIVAAHAARALGPFCRAAAVISSFVCDTAWTHEILDLYLVADVAMAKTLAARHIDPDHIVPVGLAQCGGFSAGACLHRLPTREKLRLPAHHFTVLLATEHLSPDDARRTLDALAALKDIALLIDTAHDVEMYRCLKTHLGGFSVPITLFGKQENAPEMWACADAVVLKPVDRLCARAICYGHPLVLVGPDGDRARRLAAEIEKRQLGLIAPSPRDAGGVIEILRRPETYTRLSRAALERVKTDASTRIARALEQLLRAIPVAAAKGVPDAGV